MFKSLIVTFIIGVASTAFASHAPTCEGLFTAAVQINDVAASADWSTRRAAVVGYLQAHPEIPAFYKDTWSGAVPVLLVTPSNFASVRPLIDHSFGVGLELRPSDHPLVADHGIMRVGATMMDFGHMNTRNNPKTRPTAEIHMNGIAWKELEEMLHFPRAIIMTSYLAPAHDQDVIRYYHLARRASFFRTKFHFSEDQYLDRVTPNLFEMIDENCYEFCKASFLYQAKGEMERELHRLTGLDLGVLFRSPEVQAFDREVRRRILAVDPYNPHELNWFTYQGLFYETGVFGLLNPSLPVRDREAIANLLISHDAVTQFLPVWHRYEVTGEYGHADAHRAPVSFVMVLDGTANQDDFRAGRYGAPAKFFPWTPEHQRPLTP